MIGVAQAMGAAINPEWQILAGHIAFVAVLLVRPRGLFPVSYTHLDVYKRQAGNGDCVPDESAEFDLIALGDRRVVLEARR